MKNNKSKLLLVVIYIAFISLGLPDGAFGVAWPSMRIDFEKSIEVAGIFVIIVSICSAISSLFSGKLQKKFGTGKIVFISCLVTASGLLCISVSPIYLLVMIIGVPLGFGQGAVDSSLNNYVANNYSSTHMNWLHSCWGIGASLGPFIITLMITKANSWRLGYSTLAIMQFTVMVALFFSLSLWKNDRDNLINEISNDNTKAKINTVKSVAAIISILSLLIYTGMEYSIGLWVYSMLVESRNISKGTAGLYVAYFYTTLTVGRILSGILVMKFGNRNMVRLGLLVAFIGVSIIFINNELIIMLGMIIIGLGFAPIYPCIMHETANRFESNVTKELIGYMVCAGGLGFSLIPPILGVLMGKISLEIIIPFICTLIIIEFLISEYQNKLT